MVVFRMSFLMSLVSAGFGFEMLVMLGLPGLKKSRPLAFPENR